MRPNKFFFANLVFAFVTLLLFIPIFQSFFYPIELEVRESTLWMHVLTMKADINIYNADYVAYANQAHGPFDPMIKYLFSILMPFLEPWQISRTPNVLFFISIFLINFYLLKKNQGIKIVIFLSILIYSMIYLLTKTYQGRADVTAMFLLSILVFLCSNRYVHSKNKGIIIASSFASLVILTNWRFFPVVLGIIFYPLLIKNRLEEIFSLQNLAKASKIIFFITLPFLIILLFFFDFQLKRYLNYFVTFFYFESFFSLNHFYNGFKHILRVEKLYLILFLLFLINYKFLIETSENFLTHFTRILFSLLIIISCTISYVYNYVGGGIYYFTPVVFVFWFIILDSFNNNQKISFDIKKIINSMFVLASSILLINAVKNSIKASYSLHTSKTKAIELHRYIFELSENKNILSESLHFQKKKYTNELIDIGDLLSYRSTQIGGNYEKTYSKHLKYIKDLKYDYIIHNFTGTKLIDELVKKNNYKIIKIFSDNYPNIGDIFILKRVGIEN